MVNVLSSMNAANILSSGGAPASVSSADVLPTVGVPTVSGSFLTVSAIFITASVKVVESEVPKKRKLQEQIDAQVAKEMEEEFAKESQRLCEQLARDSKIARLHAKEELKMMIEGEKLELINELVKYQDHRAKILKYQAHQSKPLSKKEQREKIYPCFQLEDFVPMSLKEEGERVKRQGLKIDQGSYKKMKTSEEELKGMMQLVPLEEVYVEALQQLDREDLHQVWTLLKETLSIKHAIKDKEIELWVELMRLFEPDFEDQLWTYNQAFMHDPLD
uniref:Uncharacterized protein n=1 Tax=Tanacetum cinerariifolium TaxID=118510 RepID=A0A6L2MK46_TANCI|nr:hypothetical protein [Tanacetum cinerariifolium]